MIDKLKECRVCKSKDLVSVVDLGEQTLASIFPADKNTDIITAPLELVKCKGECGLLQLKHTLDRDSMYGESYGYQSGINKTMTDHLKGIVEYALDVVDIQSSDIVIDIGSNDGTLLNAYPDDVESIGVDPSGIKFKKLYPKRAILFPEYFDKEFFGELKAKVITSIAMFYDLPDPLEFMIDIKHCLAEDGIWITEQAYLPTMLKNNSFDTICHEHLEYYGMTQIKWMADKIGLDILDVSVNDINGGSFMVTLAHPNSEYSRNNAEIDRLLNMEMNLELDTLKPYHEFHENIKLIKYQLYNFIKKLAAQGDTVFGYGASTKGNVILQYCGITSDLLPFIADRNPAKYGCFTPATNIPIISEEKARISNPKYFLVLPWHFQNEMVEREKDYLSKGGKFIFPLPTLKIIPSVDYTIGENND